MAEQEPQDCASQLYKPLLGLMVQDDEGKKELPSPTNKILKKNVTLNTKFLSLFLLLCCRPCKKDLQSQQIIKKLDNVRL